MKKHYFFIGSLVGLAFELLVAYWAMSKALWELMFSFEKYNGFVPILCGCMTTTAVAKLCDKTVISERYWLRGLLLPAVIFMSGVIVGSLFNMMNYQAEYSFSSEIYDYVVKPVYWLTLLGLPASLFLGSALWAVFYTKFNPLKV